MASCSKEGGVDKQTGDKSMKQKSSGKLREGLPVHQWNTNKVSREVITATEVNGRGPESVK